MSKITDVVLTGIVIVLGAAATGLVTLGFVTHGDPVSLLVIPALVGTALFGCFLLGRIMPGGVSGSTLAIGFALPYIIGPFVLAVLYGLAVAEIGYTLVLAGAIFGVGLLGAWVGRIGLPSGGRATRRRCP